MSRNSKISLRVRGRICLLKACFQWAKRGIAPLHILPYPLCGSEGKNQSFWLFFCAFCCVLSDFSRAGRRLKRIYVPVENRGPLLCASPILRAGQGLRERARKVHAAAPGSAFALPRPGARVRAAAPLAGRGKAWGLSAPARLFGRLLRPPLTFRAPLVENAKEASP